jgi:hypothetical protein
MPNINDLKRPVQTDAAAHARHLQAQEQEHQIAATLNKVGRGTLASGTHNAGAAAQAGGHVRAAGPVDATERVQSATGDNELRAILDAPPPLPATGLHTLTRDDRNSLDDFLHRTNDGDAALMWDALATMAVNSRKDSEMAADLRSALQMGKVSAKAAEIRTAQGQNSDERRQAAVTLTVSVAAAAMTYGGQKMGESSAAGQSADNVQRAGQSGAMMGQALGGVVTQTGNYISKVSGPQSEADKKKVLGMRHQMMQEIFEQGIENAKQNYDEAREQMKLAIKILTEHSERATQITTTITRI